MLPALQGARPSGCVGSQGRQMMGAVLHGAGAQALIVGVVIALVLAVIVYFVFMVVAPQFAAPAAAVVFLLGLLIVLLG